MALEKFSRKAVAVGVGVDVGSGVGVGVGVGSVVATVVSSTDTDAAAVSFAFLFTLPHEQNAVMTAKARNKDISLVALFIFSSCNVRLNLILHELIQHSMRQRFFRTLGHGMPCVEKVIVIMCNHT